MLVRIATLALLGLPVFAQTYFPAGALPAEVAQNYSHFLQAMHEPSLFELATQHPDAVAYRLLLLRDDDRPVAIRFAPRPGGTAWFYRRVTGGTGLTRPTRLRDSGMSFSWKSRTASFLKTIDNVGFWTLPDTPAAPGVPCRSHWILEGVKLGRYKVIDRCSPDDRDPVRVIGTQAMHLASLRLHGSKLY